MFKDFDFTNCECLNKFANNPTGFLQKYRKSGVLRQVVSMACKAQTYGGCGLYCVK